MGFDSREVCPQVYQGCHLPSDLVYDVERDVWLRFEADGTVTMGMTDLAQTRAGKLVSILFKPVGKRLRTGQSAATIESAKWVGPFPTPLSGEIVATNQGAFETDMAVANRDPYADGWLIRLKPSDGELESANMLSGRLAFEAFKMRIDRDGIKCMRCAD